MAQIVKKPVSWLKARPQVRKRFDELGVQMTARDQQTPEALRSFQKAEADKWWPIIKAANITAN